MEWQPIETAPKDGTWFLGWRPSKFEECRVDVWSWQGFDCREEMFVDAADLTDGYQPTHWMPIPPPPQP